ncbi:Vps53-like protein [Hygrophoropsis aurantiaca]|uniref:Vps53-like protein n=1 Tax=Hygrophoropsis aurantiaca TaxID=72124 RepID=A0ACB8AJC6_9AGAM|nr:Vps53-like protein [Hygrophoropsis aurantiaca]
MQRRYDEELPHEVIVAIQRVLELKTEQQSEDPLDVLSNNFNPEDVLNRLFPDEASLSQLETVQASLARNQHDLQQEIDSLKAELRRDQDPTRMQLIQEMISDLLGQMSRIREKATESEAVVRNITKDIQVLDLAKKNLILSMTTLKRLQMLVNAMTQLEDQVKENNYKDIAQTLAVVKQISASFKPYMTVHRILQVSKRIQQLQGEIRTRLDGEFDAFFLQDPAKPIKPSSIADACAVVDVLGPDVRTHVIDRYVALELKEYRRIFRATDEAGHLDNISRRYAWFRRLLHTHEVEQGRAFPAEWKVGWHLFAKFVGITRDDLSALLSKAGSSLTVKVLLETLQETIEFEGSISKKWATSLEGILKATTLPPASPIQSMSSAFEPHLGIFVDAQDKALSDMLAPHRGSNATKPRPSLDATPRTSADHEDSNDAPTVVLPSSTELFYFYGQTLDQCAKLSTGQALFDLCTLHKKWLRIYAEDVLSIRLKRPAVQPRKSLESRFDMVELDQACLLINTADYCQTTALELEDKIKEKISEAFRDKITLQAERDLFMSVISAGITIHLRELDAACDAAFTTMSRIQWSTLSQVSGQSSYVTDLANMAEQVADAVKPMVEQKKYLRNFLDKACSLVLTRFTNALVKSRPLKEIGAEQLLIDLQVIKSCLMKLPGDSLSSSGYTRGLTKSTTRLEALLKVIVTPVDPPEGFILNYTLLIGDASFSNFQKILDLKGTPKTEQNSLLDSFLTITSTKADLESTSFLSSLDMDPPLTAQFGATLGSPNASRIALPLATTPGGISPGGDGVFAALASPPHSGPTTGDGKAGEPGPKREVFSDIRRFVSFGLRRDMQPPA